MSPLPRRLAPALLLTAALVSGPEALAAAAPIDTLRITVRLDHTRFRESLDPWSVGSVDVSANLRPGTLIARVNQARRFGTDGTQFELDAYPDLGPGRYAYLNIGWSGASIFPHHRYGGELYTSLPGAWELSAGVRHLRFRSADVTLYTGSLGHYRGNWWFNVRPFLKPDDGDVSLSVSLLGRKYGRDRYDYWGFRVGAGASAAEFDTDVDLVRKNSVTAALDGRVPLGEGPWNLSWGLTFEWEELDGDRTRQSLGVDLGLSLVVIG